MIIILLEREREYYRGWLKFDRYQDQIADGFTKALLENFEHNVNLVKLWLRSVVRKNGLKINLLHAY